MITGYLPSATGRNTSARSVTPSSIAIGGIPIDLHSIADFDFMAAWTRFTVDEFSPAAGTPTLRPGVTKDHVPQRCHHRGRPVGLSHGARNRARPRFIFMRDAVVAALKDAQLLRERHPGPRGGVVLARARRRGRSRLEARAVAALDSAGHQRRLLGDEHAGPRAARRRRPARPRPFWCWAATPPASRGYAKVAANFNTVTQKHLAPLGHGGPNGVYALVASRQMKKYGLEKSDYGQHRGRATRMGGEQSLCGLSRAADHGGVSRRAVGRRSAVALRLRAGDRRRAGDDRRQSRLRAEGPAGRAGARASRQLQLRQPGGRRACHRHQHASPTDLWRDAHVQPGGYRPRQHL